MKKTLVLLLSFTMITVLSGCFNNDDDDVIDDIIDDVVDCDLTPEHEDCIEDIIIDYEAILLDEVTSFNLDGITALYADIILPLEAQNGVLITWESSNGDYLSNDGVITIPWFEDGDQVVILTATLTLESFTQTKEFSVLVKTYETQELSNLVFDVASFELTGNTSLEDDILLPSSFLTDIDITMGNNL